MERDNKGRFVKSHTLGFKKGHKIGLGRKYTEKTKKKMKENCWARNPLLSEKIKNRLRSYNLGKSSNFHLKGKLHSKILRIERR